MASPTQVRARSRKLQVRSGPAGNRKLGYNPAAKPGPVPTSPYAPKSAPRPAPPRRRGPLEGAMQTGLEAQRRGQSWLGRTR
jgi:hypothetical protein